MAESMVSFKYKLAATTILYNDGTKTEIDSARVKSILIEKDFDNAIFPIIRIQLSLNVEDNTRIIQEKMTTKIRLKLQKYTWSNNDQSRGVAKTLFNETFVYIVADGTPNMNKDSIERSQKSTGDSVSMDSSGSMTTLYLYKYDDLISTKQAINVVFSKTNMNDALGYILTEAGYKKVLMQPCDNSEVYSDVLIPPLTSQGAIIYLNSEYGTYKNGTILFCDVDRTYLMGKEYECKVYEEGEFKKTSFSIKKSSDSENLQTGTYIDAENKTYYINISPNSIFISNASIANDQLMGNDIVMTDPILNEVTEIKAKTIQHGKASKAFFSGSGYSVSMSKTMLGELTYSVQAKISNFDIDAITPNKKFMFTYSDKEINKEYGGEHRLTKCTFAFAASGDEFDIDGILEFRKKV